MDMDETVVEPYVFRGVEYVVSMTAKASTLTVEVEDRLTADQWSGAFDAGYVEDLTHKTGNFKEFSIFTSMLKSAIKQNSESVSLDLLTYTDLESLRSRKAGAERSNIPGPVAVLGSKRYLILTYTVEFDRIHYPLPLPYVGKPDVRTLQETIRSLRREIKQLRIENTRDYRLREQEKLKVENKKLKQQKQQLEADLIQYKREISATSKGSAAKEVRILKTMAKSLEADLLREKTKHQKSSLKRNAECRRLMDEVDELKASERNLKARVKSLTNELAFYRREGGKTLDYSQRSRRTSRQNSFTSNRASSRENSFSSRTSRTSRASRDRSLTMKERSLSRDRDRSWDSRAGSRERLSVRERSASRDRSTSRERVRPGSAEAYPGYKLRISSAGARFPRFNPTAYIEERTRRKQEAARKQKRAVRSAVSSGTQLRRTPSPQPNGYLSTKTSRSFVNGARSRTSSVESIESLSEIGRDSDNADSRLSGRTRTRNTASNSKKTVSNIPSSPDILFRTSGRNQMYETDKLVSSTPERDKASKKAWMNENVLNGLDDGYYERTEEFTDIDERLNRLQDLMKKSDLV